LIQGLAEAEITVIDRRPYQATAYLDLRQRGAELGADFDFETINELASDQALRESPFGIAVEEETWGFPANRIPLRRESYSDRLEELPEFDVSSIREQAGGKLSDVEVVVGRANSMLSPSEFQELRLRACEPHFRQSFREGIDRIKKLAHIFDAEHPKSLPLLNGLAGRLAAASGVPVHVAARLAKNLPIREASSTNSDHIQAADIASGWASDLLLATNNDYRVLAQQVRWLTINGLAVPA
jgi:hypothetical protein